MDKNSQLLLIKKMVKLSSMFRSWSSRLYNYARTSMRSTALGWWWLKPSRDKLGYFLTHSKRRFNSTSHRTSPFLGLRASFCSMKQAYQSWGFQVATLRRLYRLARFLQKLNASQSKKKIKSQREALHLAKIINQTPQDSLSLWLQGLALQMKILSWHLPLYVRTFSS